MRFVAHVCLALLLAEMCVSPAFASDRSGGSWSQFRGPNATGLASDDGSLPVEFGLEKNVVWKTPLPSGHSSPCVWGERIFLTAFDADAKQIEVLAVDRGDGRVLWRQPVAAETLEPVHQLSNPATATPAADAERVYCYFGSSGLVCFDHDGREQWKRPLPMPERRFGSGTSPIVAGEFVLLNRDDMPEPQLLAVDRQSGEIAWQRPYSSGFAIGQTLEGFSTPVVAGDEVVVHRPRDVTAYRLADGQPAWWVRVNSNGGATPAVGDGMIYVATWNNFGEPDLRVEVPAFDKLAEQYDTNKDEKLGKDEFPKDLALSRRPDTTGADGNDMLAIWFFDRVDANKDAHLSAGEWNAAVGLLTIMVRASEHGLLAIKTGGQGDVTGSHVAWRETRNIPEVPSALCDQGRVYMVRNGGILTCLDAQSGKLLYRNRVGAAGSYYSSPVAADGKLFTASQEGKIAVLAAGGEFSVLAVNDLSEEIYATPAIADGTLYVRTAGHLWAFRSATR